MGYYIERKDDDSFNKAKYFIDNHDAKRIMQHDVPGLIEAGIGVVCVVHAPAWEAAAFCYDPDEFTRFTDPFDDRKKEWLQMDREWLQEESGYNKAMEEEAAFKKMYG